MPVGYITRSILVVKVVREDTSGFFIVHHHEQLSPLYWNRIWFILNTAISFCMAMLEIFEFKTIILTFLLRDYLYHKIRHIA